MVNINDIHINMYRKILFFESILKLRKFENQKCILIYSINSTAKHLKIVLK